jgi:hypothetical protein
MDHVDRIAPAGRLRKGDEAPNIDCMVQWDDQVIVGSSDGNIRTVKFRPNAYGGVVGCCEDCVTSLAVVPEHDGWIVSASGSKVTFWDMNATESVRAEEEEEESSEDEKPKKKHKKSKKSKSTNGDSSAFFADLK